MVRYAADPPMECEMRNEGPIMDRRAQVEVLVMFSWRGEKASGRKRA